MPACPTSRFRLVERGGGNLAALEMARGGDLVLILADNVTRSWKQIIYFQPGEDVVSESLGAPVIEMPEEFSAIFPSTRTWN
jgi:cyanophycin synthetase